MKQPTDGRRRIEISTDLEGLSQVVLSIIRMPINIYIKENGENLEWLDDEIWDLPTQIHTLETWLDKKGRYLKPGRYVADIGFDIRKEALGGGGVLSSESMKIMGKIGMDVYLSEYPNSPDPTTWMRDKY